MSKKESKKIYFVGIEGAGTSALAQIYKNMGHSVSGSDNGDHFYGDVLKAANIAVFPEFLAEHIDKSIDLVVHSTAFKEDNVELAAAKELGIRILSYPQALGEVFGEKLGVAVCGTHGKTTTSALLATTMRQLGLDPSALIGSKVINWSGNTMTGKGDYFVLEADEYQNKLKYYNAWGAILTSLDWDHPDFFPDFQTYKKVFSDFLEKLPFTGLLVVWGDSADTLEVAKKAKCATLTYGFGTDNDYVVSGWEKTQRGDSFGSKFSIEFKGESLGEFEVSLVGKHNVLNAAAVVAFCHRLGISIEAIIKALGEFRGTVRRFELVGKANGALLIDDYAHHPDEVLATLAATRNLFPQEEIWVVFHPHSFTRTKALLSEFAQSFEQADKVIVIDIYGSARENEGDVSSEDLVKLINQLFHERADYIPDMKEAQGYLEKNLKDGVVLITMGAGDVWKIAHNLKQKTENS